MLDSSACELDESLRTAVYADEQIVELFLPHQVSLQLGNEDALANVEELLYLAHFLVNYALGDPVEYNAQEATDGHHDGRVEPHYWELEAAAEQRAYHFLVKDQDFHALSGGSGTVDVRDHGESPEETAF